MPATRRLSPATAASAAALLLALCVPAAPVRAENALWLRSAAISPDGKTVAFSYRGDLWTVPVAGGAATPITVAAAYDTAPVWSPDGRKIAFASDRYGNFDVFVMPAAGGEAKRLTFHSADDTPTSFTPDGKAVLFGSARLDAAKNVQFPTGAQPELYQVSLAGGMPAQLLSTPSLYAVWDKAAERLAYSDVKGYEMEWRKHDSSSFARDVWVYEKKSGKHTRLTAFGFDDRQPVWSPDEKSLYYLSEKSGTFNVWKLDLADPGKPAQVTTHKTHPVRFLSASSAGDLCYTWDGEIWVRPAGANESRKLSVTAAADRRDLEVAPVDVASDANELELSPNGKEVAFVARGEVFVASVEHGTTRRITDTPGQERSVSFSPDGKSLLYAGERDGSWNVYRTDRIDPEETAFYNATALKESAVVATAAEEFQPAFSPDGKEVAFLEERTTLKVVNLATGKSRVVLPGEMNYSYADGDQWFQWSPDGRSFAVQFLSPTRWSGEVGIVDAAGGKPVVNVTRSGYEEEAPKWARKGEVLFWASDRFGTRQHSGYPREQDVFAAFLTKKAWDRFHLDETAYAQLLEKEKEAEKKKDKDADKGKDDKKGKEAEKKADGDVKLPDPVAFELDGLDERIARLSLHSASLDDAALTPDGETLVYLARFEKGADLWKYVPRKEEVKLVAKLDAERGARLRLDPDGKKAIVLADGKLSSIDLDSGKATPIKASAKVELKAAEERTALFEHAWRQTLKKFYVEDLHGVDWPAMKTAYARFLPHVVENRDFAELISEMQGELNASHTGGRYRPQRRDGDTTASLAFFPDPAYTGEGVKVLEVIEGGPLTKAGTKVVPGVVITSIDGAPIAAGANWYPMLNRKAGQLVRLGLLDPKDGKRWEETVKPIAPGEQQGLLYDRWVKSRRAEVERLSGGRLGYAHIRGMNDGAYREIFEEVFGRAVDKDGIVLDTRWNGGGNLVEPLTVFLTGQVYARSVPRGRQIGVEPGNRWTKPSIVVMNEGNYSDAHCFPTAYKVLGIGETVGMQVPGTCTSVWWERLQDKSLTFGIPQVGYIDPAGNMAENNHLNADHEVDNDPALEVTGRDQQLEKAVEVLMKKVPK
ncbi:MAG: DPP IV N-terminal domain-containing protein, partial [Thermoanaerobaculia bacterium]|nr:DPP IV N-terminal domain-containing protein [Thermoanaerobaculia bacterium]